MSGASRWLDAFPASGPKPCAVAMVAIAAVLGRSRPMAKLAHVCSLLPAAVGDVVAAVTPLIRAALRTGSDSCDEPGSCPLSW